MIAVPRPVALLVNAAGTAINVECFGGDDGLSALPAALCSAEDVRVPTCFVHIPRGIREKLPRNTTSAFEARLTICYLPVFVTVIVDDSVEFVEKGTEGYCAGLKSADLTYI